MDDNGVNLPASTGAGFLPSTFCPIFTHSTNADFALARLRALVTGQQGGAFILGTKTKKQWLHSTWILI